MSAAACKVIIDEAAAVVGSLLCLSGSAPVADASSGGTAVTAKKAERFARAARKFQETTAALIDDFGDAIQAEEEGGS
jgi:hypothetical protein